jgi:hypothetical protein
MRYFVGRARIGIPLLGALLFTALSQSGWAQTTPTDPRSEPLVTDRPDFTESALTVPKGLAQAEFGVTVSRMGSDRETAYGELLMRLGMGPKTELRLGIPSYMSSRVAGQRTSGFSDSSLGVKYNLVRAGDALGLRQYDVGVILATTLPTGASAYRENTLQPGFKILLASAWTDKIALSGNLNYDYASEGGQRFSAVTSSFSVGYSLTDRVAAYTEYFGTYPGGKGRENSHYLNAGLTYLCNNDFQLDARAGKGLNGIDDDTFFGVGASRRF